MTETPPPAPRDPAVGDASAPGGDPQRTGHGPYSAAPGTAPQDTPPDSGQPRYGPPGTGPAAAEPPVYGYQAATYGLDVGHAISYGLDKFRSNLVSWLAITAVGVVLYLTFLLVVQTFDPTSLSTLVLLFLVVVVGLWLLQAMMVRGALLETDGPRPDFGDFMRNLNAGNVLLTALLAFLGTWLGLALCVLPGVLVGVLCMFALHFVIDQDMGPIDAIRSSAMLVTANPWKVFLLALSVLVITTVGALACGIGLLLAGPVCAIAVTYSYRVLVHGVVSPA
ncbi:hypothetical protein [Nocardia higoensis]|uniref:hypothetical protein n=1 Tax=Nocardia higoensis TaxID=228599 RepID=UPI0002EC0B56|nr:hypothetical protein [Nocardia higoensis]